VIHELKLFKRRIVEYTCYLCPRICLSWTDFFQKRRKCEIVHATQSENYIDQLEFHLLIIKQHVPLLSIASALSEKLA
jgi:hypothetical protein